MAYNKQQLENIKQYLFDNGINVESVNCWQGGFYHDGKKHGLDIIAKVTVNGLEEIYAVPRFLIQTEHKHEQLKFLKIEDF